MSSVGLPEARETLRLEEAAEWLMLLQEDDVAEQEIVRWIDWCEADAGNRAAFQSLLPLWEAFDDRPWSLAAVEEKLAAMGRRGAGHAPRVGWAVAAGVLVAIVSLVGLNVAMREGKQTSAPALASIATLHSEPGHIRPAVLPDGSKLDLGARSAIAIDFTGLLRQIDMQDGEAFFAVKPDKQKPFVVRAGAVRVTAVGTQFNVQKAGGRVVVTVTEGAVRVDSETRGARGASPDLAAAQGAGDAATQPLLAPAGYQVIYDTSESVKPTMRAVDPSAAIAWRQGHLEYNVEPLSSVIATVNRYSNRAVVLEDPSLARLNYTGTIEVASVSEWLQALPRIFPVVLQESEDGRLLIDRRP